MKRLLLITAVLLALTGAGQTVEMPKELRGQWCKVSNEEARGRYIYFQTDGEPCPPAAALDTMNVDARGFVVDEDECRLLKAVALPRPKYSPWWPPYRMTFRCVDMEGRFIVEQRWDREKGVLTVR